MIPRKLNLGCGNDYREGFYNVDIGACKKDQFLDVNEPFDLPSDHFYYVYACQVMEHIDKEKFFDIYREIHRVLAPEGVIEIMVPQAGSDNFWTDPTHTMPYTERTFDFLIEGRPLRENGIIYGADYSFKEVMSPSIDSVQTLTFVLKK